ncbi:MAG TPA: hypothetical protein VHQ02_09770 [Usitatibacter sp.]|jgi:hypothetical protein|nr:hypothetical protein [Usitatibacter sp.]
MSPRVLVVIVAIVIVIAAGTILALKRAVKTSTRDVGMDVVPARPATPLAPPK